MQKISRIADFSKDHLIGNFLGKDYEEARKNAEDWSVRTGNKIHSYFEQIFHTKTYSILFSYERGD